MANSSAHIQIQSASYATYDSLEETRVTVQPEVKCQPQSTTTGTVKITLGLLSAGVLVALAVTVVVVVINQQQVSELNKKYHSLKVMLQELQTVIAKPTEIALPQPSPTEASICTSPVTMPPETRVSTASATETTPPVAVDEKTNTPSTQSAITPTEGLTSCAAIHMSTPSALNGTYTIYPGGQDSGRRVWCDMSTDGGGWTVFQRRINGSVDFNQTWNKYERGFGLPESEMWLGNEDLHRLTTAQPSELRVDLFDWDGEHGYAKYSNFSVGNASTHYTLSVGRYNGTIGDSLAYHNFKQYFTRDRPNDRHSLNCATSQGGGGGWWYGNCDTANLNGRYILGGVSDEHGVEWHGWLGHPHDYSYRAAAMMARPRNLAAP